MRGYTEVLDNLRCKQRSIVSNNLTHGEGVLKLTESGHIIVGACEVINERSKRFLCRSDIVVNINEGFRVFLGQRSKQRRGSR